MLPLESKFDSKSLFMVFNGKFFLSGATLCALPGIPPASSEKADLAKYYIASLKK